MGLLVPQQEAGAVAVRWAVDTPVADTGTAAAAAAVVAIAEPEDEVELVEPGPEPPLPAGQVVEAAGIQAAACAGSRVPVQPSASAQQAGTLGQHWAGRIAFVEAQAWVVDKEVLD